MGDESVPNQGGKQQPAYKETDKRPKLNRGAKSELLAYCGTALGLVATGLLAKFGLYSFAIWTLFVAIVLGLLGLNIRIQDSHRIDPHTASGITIAAIFVALAVAIIIQVVIARHSGESAPQSATISNASNSQIIQAAPNAQITINNIVPAMQVVTNIPPEAFNRPVASIDDENTIATRTFWLLREKGANIILGPCPGETCFKFDLGEIETIGSSLVQNIFISGDGFKDVLRVPPKAESFAGETNLAKLNEMFRKASPGKMAGQGANFTWRSGSNRLRTENETGTNTLLGAEFGNYSLESVGLPLQTNAFVEIHARAAFVRLTVLDTRTDSLKIKLDVKRPVPFQL